MHSKSSLIHSQTLSGKAQTSLYKLYIRVEGLPKTPNQLLRKHWAIISKERIYWHNAVNIAIGSGRPKYPLGRAKLRFIRNSSREPDFDGLVGCTKFLMDSLVNCGVIQDDRPSIIGSPSFEWAKCKKGAGYMEIFVEEF